MADPVLVQPDHDFIHDVANYGAGDMKKCFQCATCSSVCSLSTEDRPFPRQQVLEAQWGMRERLIGDPAIWLCHDCGDCTLRCPRQAHPSQTIAAIRTVVIRSLAFPRFMGTMVAMQEYGAIIFLLSAAVLLALVILPLPHAAAGHPLVFAEMFPKSRLEPLFYIASGMAVLAMVVGASRFIRALRANGVKGAILPSLVPALMEIVAHRRFASCSHGERRRIGHLFVLSAFIGLAMMGTIVGLGSMFKLIDTPIPLENPLKLFANLCALVLLAGVTLLMWNRIADKEKRTHSTFCDWQFLVVLGGAGLTGALSEVLRLMQIHPWMFLIYYIHLALVLTLIFCAPYLKLAHFLYRTIAIAATWQEIHSTGRASADLRNVQVISQAAAGLHRES
jgi:quinone-modifying oxidoreductase subunit QmoC